MTGIYSFTVSVDQESKSSFVSCLWLKIPVVALKLLGRGLLPPYLKAPPGGWGRRSRGGSRWETHIKAHFMAVDKPQFLHFMGLSTRLPQGQLPPTSLHTPLSKKERLQTRRKSQCFYNLILEVTSLPQCHVLFIRSDFSMPIIRSERGLYPKKWGSLGHFRDCLPQYFNLFPRACQWF